MALPARMPRQDEDRSHLWVTFERGGKVVGRVVVRDGQVRWGPSVGIEFAYPVPGVETREEIFSRGRRGPRLLLREGLTGEIAAGWSGRLSVEDLEAWGIVKGRQGRRWVALSSGMEGRIEYRGFRISFGFGPAPEKASAAAPKRRVPLRFRRPPLARDEWPFAALAWGLYAALLALAVHLAGRPLPLAPHPEAVAQRFARLIYEAPQAPSRARTELLQRREEAEPAPEPEPKPEEPAKPEPAAEPKPAEPTKPEPAQAEPQKKAAETPPPAPPAAAPKPEGGGGPTPEQVARRREQLRESVAKKGLLGLLGGRGATSTAKARGSILEGRGAAEDLDKVLAKVEGLRAAPAGGGDGPGLGVTGVPGGPGEAAIQAAAASTRSVQLEDRPEESVKAEEDEPLDELTLKEAVAAIHRTVGTYLGGIRYLYNRELRKKPELEGKLTVSITIEPDGAVSECHVVESTLGHPPLEAAVLERVARWKFPPVAPKPVTVTYPFVFFPSM